MNTIQIDQLKRNIKQAGESLAESHAILQELIEDPTSTDLHMMELILQYRLDTQDALIKLLQIDNGLLQILGIGPQHSSKINLERMTFALGQGDLRQILNALSLLIHSLSRMARLYQEKNNNLAKQKKTLSPRSAKYIRYEQRFQKAIVQQKRFTSLLLEISNNLDEWSKLAAIGPVSQFYEPQHFFAPLKNNTAEKLEQRASAKRLGNFFNH